MSGSRDWCGWVNVSSGTGLPGGSQTKGHWAVVCVSMDKSKWHVTTDGNICCHGLWIYTILHTEEPKNCQLQQKSLGSSDERTLINLGLNAGFGYHNNTIFVV